MAAAPPQDSAPVTGHTWGGGRGQGRGRQQVSGKHVMKEALGMCSCSANSC